MVLSPIGSGVTIISQTAERIEIQASVANMQAALREISYTNSQSGSSRTTANRVVSIIVNDGTEDSNQVVRTIKPSHVPQPIGPFYSNCINSYFCVRLYQDETGIK